MRLTLRTLLAYLDDILDPADKEQLAKKIESSEFAEDLVHRTRDAVRRLRLSAPQVIGSGMGLDPNTVAEYLDNVLPPESVGDFERICLESDMHLAEAAACHHVLTMVLGEPADVDVRARQRMYTIASEGDARRRVRVEAAHVAVATEPAVMPPVQVMAAPATVLNEPSGVTEVPDYLRASNWPGLRMVLAGLAALALVAAALYVVGDRNGWFGGEGGRNLAAVAAPTAADEPARSTDVAQEIPALPRDPVVEASANAREQEAPAGDATVDLTASAPLADTSTTLESPPQPLTPSIVADAATAGAVDTTATGSTTTLPIPPQTPPVATEGANEEASMDIGPALSTEAAAGTTNIATPTPNLNDLPPDTDVTAAAAAPTDTDIGAAATTEPVAADAGTGNVPATGGAAPGEVTPAVGVEPGIAGPTEETVPAGPPELGTYLGGKTVLLRYSDEAGGWFRVEPRSGIVAGNRLLALPQFRPKITLASGVHMDVSGGTQVRARAANELEAAGLGEVAADVPAVEVIYGRVILINTSMEPRQIRVSAGPSVGDALLDRNATLAIEVERQYVPGNDPQQTPSPVIAKFYVPSGGVEWTDASGTKKIDNTSRWSIEAGSATDVVGDSSPPDWIDQEPVGQRSEQLYGAPVIESSMTSDKPADIQLLELYQGNGRKEVKSLAAKSSVHVGLFEPFIEALRDSEQKANWPAHITTLRAAMALSPESAGNVKRALDEQRGSPAADDLYEMLCGYNADQVGRTPEEIRSGALARLINWLEEDSLDYRVLAVHDLWETTGKRLMPNPAANLKERQQNVRRWRSRLEAGDLQPVRP